MKTYINLIVDISGSMKNIKTDMEGALEEILETHQKADYNGYVSLWKFSDDLSEIYKEKPLKEISTHVSITPTNSTSLLDAIGTILDDYNMGCKNCERDNKHLFIIVTDGQENSSKKFNRTQIFQKISDFRKKGCEFVYIGANQDSFAESYSMGINNHFLYYNNSRSIREMSNIIGSCTMNYATGQTSSVSLSKNETDTKDK